MASFYTPRKKNKTKSTPGTIEITGYVNFFGPCKSEFFEVYISVESEEIRLVSFYLDRYEEVKDANTKGVTITHLKRSSTSGDLVFSSATKIILTDPPFKHIKKFDVPVTSVKDAIQDKPLYSRLTLQVAVVGIDKPGMSTELLPFQELMISDNSLNDPRPLTVYGDLVGKISANKCYKFTHVTMSLYKSKRVLKCSDRTELLELDDDFIKLPVVPTLKMNGIISGIKLSSLQKIPVCPHCKNRVELSSSFASCTTCDEAISSSDILRVSIIQFTFKDSIKNKSYPLRCDHTLLESLCSVSIDNIDVSLRELINLKVQVEMKPKSNEVFAIRKMNDDMPRYKPASFSAQSTETGKKDKSSTKSNTNH